MWIDKRFFSFEEFQDALHKYSVEHGFTCRYKKHDDQRSTVRCRAKSCPWGIYVCRVPTTELICVKKVYGNHTCEGAAGYRATKGRVESVIKQKMEVCPSYMVKDIVGDVKKAYGVQLSYSQAWRQKDLAREQLLASSYAQLPYFCEKVKETNPGSIATLVTQNNVSFHRFFLAYYALIEGFKQGCRPLIFLDTVSINSKYRGILLAAVSVDAQNYVFPLAFGVVDVESEENWTWFLSELKSSISPLCQLTFIAGFENGVKNSLFDVFGECHHGYCLQQVLRKMSEDLRDFSHEARELMVADLYAAAYAPTVEGFRRSAKNIEDISPTAYKWVIESEPEHWANAFFRGARYNHMSSDIGKHFYSWVSEANELPITEMFDVLRDKMMEAIYARRVESNQWMTKLTPSNEEKLQKEILAARSLKVLMSRGSTFEVHGESVDMVNVDDWDCNCSCKGRQLTGLPCSHAIAVFECTGRSSYDYCLRHFETRSYGLTYAESIHPVQYVDRPVSSKSIELEVIVTAPPTKRLPGRPKTKQAESVVVKRQLRCGKCKGLGHNRKTCKES